MIKLVTYLSFNGNCREAMTFYQECLGGKLEIQTVGESPLANEMPKTMKGCILHSCLFTDHFTLMGSDLMGNEKLRKGNSTSILIEFTTEKDMRKCFDKMTKNGTNVTPIEKTFWGSLFGSQTDKFDRQWQFNFKLSQQ